MTSSVDVDEMRTPHASRRGWDFSDLAAMNPSRGVWGSWISVRFMVLAALFGAPMLQWQVIYTIAVWGEPVTWVALMVRIGSFAATVSWIGLFFWALAKRKVTDEQFMDRLREVDRPTLIAWKESGQCVNPLVVQRLLDERN